MTKEGKLSVPARPAAVTLANLVGLGAAGVATAGSVVFAAIAAAVLGGGAVIEGGRRTVAHRNARRAAAARSGGATGRSGSVRAAGRSRMRAAGTAGKSATGTARRAVGRTGTGVRPGPLAPVGRAVRKGLGALAGTTGKKSRVAAGTSRAPGAGTARGAGGSARKSPATRVRTQAWRGARKFVQRHVMGRGKPAPKKGPGASHGTVVAGVKARPVAESVTESAGQQITAAVPAAAVSAVPGAASSPARQSSITHTEYTGGDMYQAAKKIEEYAAAFDDGEPGMLEVLDKLTHEVMPAIATFSEAIGIIVAISKRKFPLDPSIIAKFNVVEEMLDAGSNVAKNIPNDIEIVHKDRLRELRNPGVGAERWDHERNVGRR